MNWDQIETRWKDLTASAKENWGKLPDAYFDEISGKREQLTARFRLYMESRENKLTSRFGTGERQLSEHKRKLLRLASLTAASSASEDPGGSRCRLEI